MLVRRLLIGSAALAGAAALAACGSGDASAKPTASHSPSATATDTAGAAAVTWPAPADAAASVKAAGLPMLGAEGQALHIHSHLDILVDGKPVQVPANIGIDLKQQKISPLHTHDTTGIVHIESPVQADFTLGQFMTEWNAPFGKDKLGALKTGGGNELHVYVNGKEQTGDPAALKLADHQEIAVVYGKAGQKFPTSYAWPAGL
ncbi:hypothetical protein QMK19_21655 [Streptomyces sp. H10-C2]|uniref:hypothetical protein n=1 Tax=unclassified Streptomyces TaxID=2593676 RepID=UPI0024B99559|nr:MULTISPECIES: hypothetical protein [unclassified Streptomyces]MDJ0342343.1 hypothetical protein [Streptomyces sp. PH10-H1]MDJ0372198.1 hypothetical protein [Streptomyces sp. H10-C2]